MHTIESYPIFIEQFMSMQEIYVHARNLCTCKKLTYVYTIKLQCVLCSSSYIT